VAPREWSGVRQDPVLTGRSGRAMSGVAMIMNVCVA